MISSVASRELTNKEEEEVQKINIATFNKAILEE